MANWHAMQKRKRLMMDTPLQEDMVGSGGSHMHDEFTRKNNINHGPKNMNKGYGSEVPGGPPMYGEEKPGGPPMMSKGPKAVDTITAGFEASKNKKKSGRKINAKAVNEAAGGPKTNTNTRVTDNDKENAD